MSVLYLLRQPLFLVSMMLLPPEESGFWLHHLHIEILCDFIVVIM